MVRCGNKVHTEKTMHASVGEVRACYAGKAEPKSLHEAFVIARENDRLWAECLREKAEFARLEREQEEAVYRWKMERDRALFLR